jgi:hypothetical protein
MRIAAVLAATLAVFGTAGPSLAGEAHVEAELTGASLVPPVDTAARGSVEAVFNTDTGEIVWFIDYRDLSGPVTAIRLHGPATAGENGEALVSPSGVAGRPILGGTTISGAVVEHLMAGLLYLVVATVAFPEGELRGQMVVGEVDEGAGGDE